MNPFCNRRRAGVQLRWTRLAGNRTPSGHPPSRASREAISPMARVPRRNIEETIMLRKFSLVAIAAASLGVAALAPTSASAWGGRYHGGWHHGWGFGGPR